MVTVSTTDIFDNWVDNLDKRVRVRVQTRIGNITNGHFGDTKNLGDGVSELRFHLRSGIRVYYTRRGGDVVILLAGGDKDGH